MRLSEMKVGIFDSGIGGLTVLKTCQSLLPEVQYLYYGDNLNAPYGGKSADEIFGLTERAVKELGQAGAQAVVLACNTATAVCAERLRAECAFPVIGMEPAVKPAVKECRRVLVLATPRTAESERLQALVGREGKGEVTVYGAPRLAGAIERALCFGERLTISDHLPAGSYDGVVLGCTHYVYFGREIADFYGAKVFDGNFGTAKRLRNLLEMNKLGIGDHLRPRPELLENLKNQVVFLGKSAEMNQKIYKENNCFQNI